MSLCHLLNLVKLHGKLNFVWTVSFVDILGAQVDIVGWYVLFRDSKTLLLKLQICIVWSGLFIHFIRNRIDIILFSCTHSIKTILVKLKFNVDDDSGEKRSSNERAEKQTTCTTTYMLSILVWSGTIWYKCMHMCSHLML